LEAIGPARNFPDEIGRGACPKGVRHVAETSRLPDYPGDTTRDLEHVRLLADRFDVYLSGLRESRAVAEKEGDTGTVDLVTAVITEAGKHAWFLRASLEG
jgi:starvation-inducible DNA-binding protein